LRITMTAVTIYTRAGECKDERRLVEALASYMTGGEESIMRKRQSMVRLTLLLLPLLLFPAAIGWAQASSPMEASPVAMASPTAGPSGYMPGQRMAGGPWPGFYLCRHRGVLVVGLILRALLTLSAIFALTALGIFLIRRSRPRP
jgi:hypothetical protein